MYISYLREPGLATRDGSDAAPGLPPALQNTAPYCAAACIAAYIKQEFLCSSSDLPCLCETYSSTGYTLGELAYGCLELNCSDPPHQAQVTLYSICNSQQDLVIPTHTVISLPPLATTSSIPSSASTSSSTSINSVIATATSATVTFSGNASQPLTSSSTSGLTSAQAAGVSIAALGVIILSGLLILSIMAIRKHRSRRKPPVKSSYDFVDEEPSRQLKFQQRLMSGPVAAPVSTQQAQISKTTFSWYGQDDENKRKSRTIRHVGPEQQQQQQQSRRSDESTRTVSQLLPDKPWPLPSAPARTATVKTQDAASPATVFDNYSSPQLGIVIEKPRAAVLTNTSRQSPSRQPPLCLEIPRIAGRSPKDRPRIAVQPHADASFEPLPAFSSNTDTSQPLRQYYVTNESQSPESPTPIDDLEQKRKAVPPSIKIPELVCPEKAFRVSGGSDTSFESTDLDEPTPPETKALTPVAESPVHYPKIPRSSNQAISRSQEAAAGRVQATPQGKTSDALTLSGTTLLRNKTDKKTTVPLPFASTDPMRQVRRLPGQESPLRGYGRTAQNGLPSNPREAYTNRARHDRTMALRSPSTPKIKYQEATVTSPIWEPKLTPSRRGDDLFLSVSGLASPAIMAPPREVWSART